MTASPPAPGRRGPPAIAWIVLIAVLIGMAGALLARPFGTAAPGTPIVGGLTLVQVGEIAAVVVVAGLCAWLYLALRNAGSRGIFSERLIATILVTLLLGALVVEVLNLVHAAPILGGGNSTTPPSSPGTPTNGTPGPLPPLIHGSGVTLPAWAGYVVLIGIAVLTVVAAIPLFRARAAAQRRRGDERETPEQAAQKALEETLQRLDGAAPSDARAAILALYSRLLVVVGPRIGRLDSRTPREIERASIAVLGLRPPVAESLRETFEEARYSTHPMTLAAVERARTAFSEALQDLAPPRSVPA